MSSVMTWPMANDTNAPDLDHPIAARGLHLAYGRHEVLRGVDLAIGRGEVVGLIGRNGAGKSTLLGCLLGLLQPAQGQASIMGAPALKLDDARKARLAYVPQQPQAFGWMKVQQLCDYLAQLYPQWDRQRARTLLERWQLDPKQQIAKLSPGQAQRLAVVRALVPRPDLLVLDEPASALDPVARRELLREIVAMTGQDGTTVLLSTHIVSDLERVASRVAFLHEGRMLFDQPLDDLKDHTVRVLVPAAYAGAVPVDMPGVLARHVLDDGGLLVVLRADARLHDGLQAIDGLRVDRLGLEDLFVEIAG
ncbi:MAG: ABC transporter ATP-binding protein [Pseudoxanthomonas sp.]